MSLLVVSWNNMTLSYNHSVTYSLYISLDDGLNWVAIAESISDTSYSLDTTKYADGENYQLRLVAQSEHGLIQSSYSKLFSILNNPDVVTETETQTVINTVTATEDDTDTEGFIDNINAPNLAILFLLLLLVPTIKLKKK
jgi:hypothetical protein